jgi:hypothetical protein
LLPFVYLCLPPACSTLSDLDFVCLYALFCRSASNGPPYACLVPFLVPAMQVPAALPARLRCAGYRLRLYRCLPAGSFACLLVTVLVVLPLYFCLLVWCVGFVLLPDNAVPLYAAVLVPFWCSCSGCIIFAGLALLFRSAPLAPCTLTRLSLVLVLICSLRSCVCSRCHRYCSTLRSAACTLVPVRYTFAAIANASCVVELLIWVLRLLHTLDRCCTLRFCCLFI